jgi:L-2-hydroxyglutarate oxidase LhgO
LDLSHQARFGPDVEWIGNIDYTLDESRGRSFYADIRRYWPDLADGRVQPGYTGISPKLSKQGEPAADFVIQGPSDHSVDNVVNLFGIESPGLTASLAIAEELATAWPCICDSPLRAVAKAELESEIDPRCPRPRP